MAEMKVIRRVSRFNTAFYLNLPKIWIENNAIRNRQPMVIVMKNNGNLEITKSREGRL